MTLYSKIHRKYINYQGWPDLNHDLNQAIKVTKSDFFDFFDFFDF